MENMPNLSELPSNHARRDFLAAAGIAAIGAAAIPKWAWARGDQEFPAVRGLIGEYVGSRKVAGALAAVGKGMTPADHIAQGTQALGGARPVDRDSLWRIYSQTKPVTGMAVMMLIEDGEFALDTPLADILPEFAEMRVLQDPDGPLDQTVPARAPITIRNLLTHTAGLGYTVVQTGPIQKAYFEHGITPGAISRLPLPGFPAGIRTAPSLAEFSRRLAELPLVYEPGTRWSYSVAIDLLGRVIEVAAGQPFDIFLQQRIFDPLDMSSTFFRVPTGEVDRLTTNYAVLAGTLLPIDPAANSIFLDEPPFPFGGAGLVSSARDYDRFLMMLLGRGRLGDAQLMKPDTVALALSNLLPAGASTEASLVAGHGFGAAGRVGLGSAESPAGSYGWGGAAGTLGFVDTVRGFRAGGYAQYMPSTTYGFQREFADAVYADMPG